MVKGYPKISSCMVYFEVLDYVKNYKAICHPRSTLHLSTAIENLNSKFGINFKTFSPIFVLRHFIMNLYQAYL